MYMKTLKYKKKIVPKHVEQEGTVSKQAGKIQNLTKFRTLSL